MSYNHNDDFANLVSRANPAAQQPSYRQPSSNNNSSSYPPQQPGPAPSINSGQYALDPFFDDEDELQTPHANSTSFNTASAAGSSRQPATLLDDPLESTADLPLTKAAVPPAGTNFSLGESSSKQWMFDDDDAPEPTRFDGRGLPPSNTPVRTKVRRNFQWPWAKKKILAPERKIWLNDTASNDAEGYCSNYVSTTKYNLITFVPKFLGGEQGLNAAFTHALITPSRTILKIRKRVLLVHRYATPFCGYYGLYGRLTMAF